MVTRKALPWLVLLLALPAARGQDEPKKDDKPPPTAKEQFTALVKDHAAERQKMVTEIGKLKGDERSELLQKYFGLGKEYAVKVYQLAEDHPTDPVAADAVFWVLANGAGSTVSQKAEAKVAALVADLKPAELKARLGAIRAMSPALLDAVLKRADTAEGDAAADLLAWVASARGSFAPGSMPKSVAAATDRLLEKYPNNPAVARIVSGLARGGAADAKVLAKLADTATDPKLKAEATLALGQNLVAQVDALGDKPAELAKVAAEAEKTLASAVALLAKADLAAQKETAERVLTAFRTLRVGKEAPDIKGADLDGKEFKLTDYRGKVVLLDFWGDW